MTAIEHSPYRLEKVDLGDTDGIGFGLGLNVDRDSRISKSSSSSSSSFRLNQQENLSALQQRPQATYGQRQENQVGENLPSSSSAAAIAPNLFLTPPPPRPKRRSRHEHNRNDSADSEHSRGGDLDVQIEAALSFVSRHGLNTNMAQRNTSLKGTSSQETIRLRNDFRKALSRINEQTENGNANSTMHANSLGRNLSELNGTSTTVNNPTQRSSRARLRSSALLRAFSKGRPNLSLESTKAMLGTSVIGFSSPSRTTQMTFDALPENVVGPSNRLGMAEYVAWSPHENSNIHSSNTEQRQRSFSNATSTSSNRNSQFEARDDQDNMKNKTNDQNQTSSIMKALKAAKEEVREAQLTKAKLMTEMEEMSEQLFMEANEMVKQERVKSSALEKELESLKLAMSNVREGANNANQQTDLTHNIEAGAQNDSEAMMMAAVAEASRECAEAEEEAEEWRKHCEGLESRIAILEEALYNSMALLSQQECENGYGDEDLNKQNGHRLAKNALFSKQDDESDNVKECEPMDGTQSRNSLIIPNQAFSDSTSSFHSIGDQSSVGMLSPEANNLSPTLSVSPNEKDFHAANVQVDQDENVELYQSKRVQEDEALDEKVRAMDNVVGESNESYPQLEAEIAQSTSSHQSSSSSAAAASYGAIPARSSGVGSRRQSRQASLPPRLPEPVSPLPRIPKDEEGSENGNSGDLLMLHPSARLSVATTTSRSSSNLKHENDLNQFCISDDVDNSSEEPSKAQKASLKTIDHETKQKRGIKVEPTNHILTFERKSGSETSDVNEIISSRKESITTASTASSPILQTPPLNTALMSTYSYGDKLGLISSSKRGSIIPVVQEEETADSFFEATQNGKEHVRSATKEKGTKIGEKEKINSSFMPKESNSSSIDERDDQERESHETSRAPSYIASSTRPSLQTTETSRKKKSQKHHILKNMPPAAPTNGRGSISVGEETDLNGSIRSPSLYSVISSSSIKGENEKEISKKSGHQSSIRDHYAKIHQNFPSLEDEKKKKQSFARRKRFNDRNYQA